MFKPKEKTATSSSPREALKATNVALVGALKAANVAQGNIDRLRRIIAAEAPAKSALDRAVKADGGKALAEYSGGRDGIGKLILESQNATRAAEAAKAALPAATEALVEANREIARLEQEKSDAINDVLRAEGAAIAERYLNLFRELGKAHDQLVGFARGAKLLDVVLTDQPFEVPRFAIGPMLISQPTNLKAGFSHHGLQHDKPWSPFLRYEPDQDEMSATRSVWMRFARVLQKNPNATLADLPAANEEIETEDAERGLIRHPIRERADPTPEEALVAGILSRDDRRLAVRPE